MARNEHLRQLVAFCVLLVPTIPMWLLTTDPSDLKMLITFLAFPAVLIIASRKSQSGLVAGFPGNAHPMSFLIPLLAAYMLLNWYALSFPYYGNRTMVFNWLMMCGVAGGAFLFKKDKDPELFGAVVIFVGVIASAYAFLEYFAFIPYFNPESFPPRVTGLFGHKNGLGMWLLCALVWNVHFILTKRRAWTHIGLGLTMIIMACAILIADSRASLLLTLISLAAFVAFVFAKHRDMISLRYRILMYLLLFAVALIPVLFWSEQVWFRFALLTVPGNDSSIMMRIATYQAQWELFLQNPFFGVGIGNSVNLLSAHFPVWFRQVMSPTLLARNGHCDYLEALCELGATGFLLYIGVWFGALIAGIRQVFRSRSRTQLIMLITLFAFSVDAFFDTPSRQFPGGFLLWIHIGYFWRNPVVFSWKALPLKARHAFGIGGTIIHLVLLLLFVQILAGDYLYLSSRHPEKTGVPSGKRLEQCLRICPNHPEALYQLAYIGIATRQYDYVKGLLTALDTSAPFLRPTDFVWSLVFLQEKDFARALMHAERQLQLTPRMLDAFTAKIGALAGSGKCAEMSRLRDSLTIRISTRLKTPPSELFAPDSQAINKDFNLVIQGRDLFGKRRLQRAHRAYWQVRLDRAKDRYFQFRRIAEIKCTAQQ